MAISQRDYSGTDGGKHLNRHLRFAESIIRGYRGPEPFHHYLRKYFSLNKKHGSKDRKQITSLCYDYFRLGHGVIADLPFEDKLLLGTFLCESNPFRLAGIVEAGGNEHIRLEVQDKLKLVETSFDPVKIFPFPRELSNEINVEKFNLSFLKQPRLFIRLRPGKESSAVRKIEEANFSFEKIGDNTLAFSPNEKVSDVLDIDKEAVIQDYNSQRVGEFFPTFILDDNSRISVWDCCAGSGGKSILAVDVLKKVKLTVTDSRISIIENLKKRFSAAGIKNFEAYVADLSSHAASPVERRFKMIIADLSCSGSGTWSRSPEQLCFFRKEKISEYSSLQKSIIKKVIPLLESDGIFLYVTCSVFRKENEENVDYLLERFRLKLLRMEYLKGYEMKADTLFVAVFARQYTENQNL